MKAWNVNRSVADGNYKQIHGLGRHIGSWGRVNRECVPLPVTILGPRQRVISESQLPFCS
jgi:hypothetical protein